MVIGERTFNGEAHLYPRVTQPICQSTAIPQIDVVATAVGRSFIRTAPEILEKNNALLPFQAVLEIYALDDFHTLQAGNPGPTQGFGQFFGSQYVSFALGVLPTMTHASELAHVDTCAPQGDAEVDGALVAEVLRAISSAGGGIAEYFRVAFPQLIEREHPASPEIPDPEGPSLADDKRLSFAQLFPHQCFFS
jgi:hypothetical protein